MKPRTILAGSRLAGWARLTRTYAIPAPLRQPSCVSDRHVRGSRRTEVDWTVFDKHYWPGDTFADHLAFALRHETIDLLVTRRVLEAAPKNEVEDLVRNAPTGIPARRAWYRPVPPRSYVFSVSMPRDAVTLWIQAE